MNRLFALFLAFVVVVAGINLSKPLLSYAASPEDPIPLSRSYAPSQMPALIDLDSIEISDNDVQKNAAPLLFFLSSASVGKVTVRYILSSDGFTPEYYYYTATLGGSCSAWQIKTTNPYAGQYRIDYIQVENKYTASSYKIYDSRSHTEAELVGKDMLADLSGGDYLTRPSKIINVKADLYNTEASQYRSVLVSWTNPGDVEGFRVYYKQSGAVSWSYEDTSQNYLIKTMPTAGVKYYFLVKAISIVDDTYYYSDDYSDIKSVYTLSKIKLSVTRSGDHYLKLSWPDIPGQTGYEVYRANSFSDYYYYNNFYKIKTLASTTATSYLDTTTVVGKEYYYKVRAYKKVYYSSTEYYYVYSPFSDGKGMAIINLKLASNILTILK